MQKVRGFPLALDRSYHPGSHMWVKLTAPGTVRIGMDPLVLEASVPLAARTSGSMPILTVPGAVSLTHMWEPGW